MTASGPGFLGCADGGVGGKRGGMTDRGGKGPEGWGVPKDLKIVLHSHICHPYLPFDGIWLKLNICIRMKQPSNKL